MDELGRIIEAIDSHTEGEPTRIVTSLGAIPGDTMVLKRDYLREHHDELRRALVLEPRGHDAIVLALLTDPVSDEADAGVVFADEAGFLGMCGHGTIGVATALVRSGRITCNEPVTRVVLDTPVGQVSAEVQVSAGKPRSVRFRNVPAFVQARDLAIRVPGLGKIRVDVAYGGNWFAFVHQDDVGMSVEPRQLDELMRHAMAIRSALEDASITGESPTTGAAESIDHVVIWVDEGDSGTASRSLTLCPGRAYDRSPCGTGTSARLALLHASGALKLDEVFKSRSILGTEFRARVVEETEVSGKPAIIPEIEGSAWITGLQRFVLDPEDPLVHGMGPGS